MDRMFDKVFAQAAAAVGNAQEQADTDHQQVVKERNKEDDLRKISTDMTASDAIQRIILAGKDKDYFR